MSDVSAWATRAAGNTAASPDGFPEGQSPATLNDCARELMAAVRRSWAVIETNNWQQVQAAFPVSAEGIAFGGDYETTATGVVVGVLTGGQPLIYRTTDYGRTWTVVSTALTSALYGVVYGSSGNLFIAVGQGGLIVTSPAGDVWTTRTSGTTNQLNKICFGPIPVVAVGNSGTIVTSSDGITWTVRTSGTAQNLNDSFYGNFLYAAVGNSGTIVTSSDLVTWTVRTSGTTQHLRSVTWINSLSLYIAVGDNGTIVTSPDGSTWTVRTSGVTDHLKVVVGDSNVNGSRMALAAGDNGILVSSFDGITWTRRYFFSVSVNVTDMRHASNTTGNRFFAVSAGGIFASETVA